VIRIPNRDHSFSGAEEESSASFLFWSSIVSKSQLLVRGSGKLSRRRQFVLSLGNDKIGESIFAFNLPAVVTCPGMSSACVSCYAQKGRWRFPSVRKALKRNWEATQEPFFAERLIREIWDRGAQVVRIHASGDFFTPQYIRNWIRVARNCQGTTFYGYTRSWRLPGLRVELERLSALPNVRLWYSADRDTGMPGDLPHEIRVAWLQESIDDPIPEGVDLIFRIHRLRREPARKVNLTLICPAEQGSGTETTCSTCRLCWK
jgi:hypothetical protein